MIDFSTPARLLNSVKHYSGQRKQFTHPHCTGLILMAVRAGKAHWLFRYQWGKKLSFLRLADYPTMSMGEAVIAAGQARILVAAGEDPRTKKNAKPQTLNDLLDQHDKQFAKNNTKVHFEYSVKILRAHLGETELAALGRKGGATMVKECVDKQYGTSRPTVARKMLRDCDYAWKRGRNELAEVNTAGLISPFEGMLDYLPALKAYRGTSRAMNFTDESYREMLLNLRDARQHWWPFGPMILELQLLHGCRPSEMKAAKQSELSEDVYLMPDGTKRPCWLINKTDHKNVDKPDAPLRRIWAFDLGGQVFKDAEADRDRFGYNGDLLFPARRSGPMPKNRELTCDPEKHVSNLNRCAEWMSEHYKMPFTPYNLRSGYICYALDHGEDIAVVANNCGNSPETIRKHYYMLRPDQLKAAAMRVNDLQRELMNRPAADADSRKAHP